MFLKVPGNLWQPCQISYFLLNWVKLTNDKTCKWLGIKLFRKKSNQKPKTNKYVAGGKTPIGARNSGIVEEECNQANKPRSKPVYKQYFPQGEKRQTLSTSDKLEATKSVSPIPSFQNGRSKSSKRTTEQLLEKNMVILLPQNLSFVMNNEKLHGKIAWTKPSYGILGIHHNFGVHNNLPPRRENIEANVPLRNTFECGPSESKGNSQRVGNVDFNILSSTVRSTPLSVTSDATNKKPSGEPDLGNTSASNTRISGQTEMVAQQLTSEQGKDNFSPCTRFNNTTRCCKIEGGGVGEPPTVRVL